MFFVSMGYVTGSKILQELEETLGGNRGTPMGDAIATALERFWDFIGYYEEGSLLDPELSLNPGETLTLRFTRWTNFDWLDAGTLAYNFGRVPPHRRRALVRAMMELFGEYAAD